jgi:hypothetical protein
MGAGRRRHSARRGRAEAVLAEEEEIRNELIARLDGMAD